MNMDLNDIEMHANEAANAMETTVDVEERESVVIESTETMTTTSDEAMEGETTTLDHVVENMQAAGDDSEEHYAQEDDFECTQILPHDDVVEPMEDAEEQQHTTITATTSALQTVTEATVEEEETTVSINPEPTVDENPIAPSNESAKKVTEAVEAVTTEPHCLTNATVAIMETTTTTVETVKTVETVEVQESASILPPAQALTPVQTPSTSTISLESTDSPVKFMKNEAKNAASTSLEAKFTLLFPEIWSEMLKHGWHTAQGPNTTTFYVMPGTQFLSFRPNVNVFDSFEKAVWKQMEVLACSSSSSSSSSSSEKDNESTTQTYDFLWDLLWTVLKDECNWTTMNCGTESWFMKPNTRFESFQPNVTIFQTKKLAVLKSLEDAGVQIELGESVDGAQRISFVKKPVVTKQQKKKKQQDLLLATPTTTDGVSMPVKRALDTFASPSPVGRSSSTKAHLSVSSSATKSAGVRGSAVKKGKAVGPVSASKKAATPRKTPLKKAMKTPTIKKTPVKASTPAKEVAFHIPEFKVTIGRVYQKLQERGWYHRHGKFEYDYFSPDYTKDNAVPNGNYFHGLADLEAYIKDCGIWDEIESGLRDEHEELVKELREDAVEKQQELAKKRALKAKMEKKAKREASDEEKEPVSKEKKSVKATGRTPLKNMNNRMTPSKRKSLEDESLEAVAAAPAFKCTWGLVEKKLKARGWHYKPGRFEYDYFKPGKDEKNGVLNEDYFHSTNEVERYLRCTGLWEEIENELRRESRKAYRAAMSQSADEEEEEEEEEDGVTPVKKKAKKTVTPMTPTTTTVMKADTTMTKKVKESEYVNDENVAVDANITNDIWANSHEFVFEHN